MRKGEILSPISYKLLSPSHGAILFLLLRASPVPFLFPLGEIYGAILRVDVYDAARMERTPETSDPPLHDLPLSEFAGVRIIYMCVYIGVAGLFNPRVAFASERLYSREE